MSLNTRGLRNVFLILTKLMLSNDIQRVDWRSCIHSFSALLQNYPWKTKTRERCLFGLHGFGPAIEVLLLNKGLALRHWIVPRVLRSVVISCSEQVSCYWATCLLYLVVRVDRVSHVDLPGRAKSHRFTPNKCAAPTAHTGHSRPLIRSLFQSFFPAICLIPFLFCLFWHWMRNKLETLHGG